MQYNDVLKLIEEKQSLGIKPGLERIKLLLEKMGNPQNQIKQIIHIAGTNGKGTVASAIAKALKRSGAKVGLFTTPWVVDYQEQIKINNKRISKSDLVKYIMKYYDCDATEFELLTAIMYKYFADEQVDYAVIECGMGGKNDATNVEEKNISVITSIDFDHTDYLGHTLEEIAEQKAGIIRPGCLCILYPNPKCDWVFKNICDRKKAFLIKVKDTGDYLKNDLATAQTVLDVLKIDIPVVNPKLQARQFYVNGVLTDGGHNADAAKALAPKLDGEVAIIGMMKDKNAEEYLSIIAPKCKKIYTVSVNNPRSMHPIDLANIAKSYCKDVEAYDDVQKALEDAKENNLSLVCGSFYLYREIRKELLK